MSPFPTNQGWFILYYNSDIITDSIDLSDTHQYTIELEMYPIEYYYNFKVIMNYETNSQLIVEFNFLNYRCSHYDDYYNYYNRYSYYCDSWEYYSIAYIRGNYMSSSTVFNIQPRNWYKVSLS